MPRPPFDPTRIRGSRHAGAADADAPRTVSQITREVKDAVAKAFPKTVHVVGEVSNFKRHSSGHLYFTLKDDQSELACVMWRSAAASLKFEPESGMETIAGGTIEVFERAGRYQLYVRKLEPRGVGALELAFRQLCEKLEKEGLFDPAKKKPLPPMPRRIAIVTSPTGAAVADMLRTIRRRFPAVNVLVYPVRVQGDLAAAEIAAAIRNLNKQCAALGGIDTLIVGRGGGSIEDLWAFNEEVVARAISASTIPVISAVGHETDFTIADYVADHRAATPTAAAEIAVPVLDELLAALSSTHARLSRSVAQQVKLATSTLAAQTARRSLADPQALLLRRTQRIDLAQSKMTKRLTDAHRRQRNRIDRAEALLARIAPAAVIRNARAIIDTRQRKLERTLAVAAAASARTLERTATRLAAADPAREVATKRQQVAALAHALVAAQRSTMKLRRRSLDGRIDHLRAVGYESILARGFSVTRTKKERKVVRNIGDLRDGDRLITQVADGTVESEVTGLDQLELFGG